ncbi:MAG: hypothetical protein ABTQ34_09585 [Bdellovibrionales bacterium]
MTESADNLILRMLQEMRAESAARDERIEAQIGALAEGQISLRAGQAKLWDELKEIRTEIKLLRNQIHELAIAVDHHTSRLDRIEQHLGLDNARH